MASPEVSVIVPVYNVARYVATALESVQAQTFGDYEIIVVDDGSSDDTAERAWRAAPHALHLRQENGGPARARNTAIARARGRYLAFLDGDDLWFPEKLAVQVAYMRRHPHAGLSHHQVRHQLPDDDAGARRGAPPPRDRFCDLFHLRGWSIRTSTVLALRSVVVEVGGFDERRELYVEDWDLWLRIAAKRPIGDLQQVLGYIRPGGFMSSAVERTYRGQELVQEKALALCQKVCPHHRHDPQRCLAESRFRLGQELGRDRLRQGDRLAARAAFSTAIEARPRSVGARLLHAATYLSTAWLERLYALKARLRRA